MIFDFIIEMYILKNYFYIFFIVKVILFIL
jgi:hypothetical protein